MICPKCGKNMLLGALGPSAKGALYWAREDYFKSKVCIFLQKEMQLKMVLFIFPLVME
ncbi:hypothetical protein [Lachnospira eligens]|jgi:hypothetical protein|uniref:hypothetical protein n=1 Tax=Lachnospira eligens TaxID=39485 RepID=UPI0016514DC6|nr:hypothetical protein [Lachnospira eligens]